AGGGTTKTPHSVLSSMTDVAVGKHSACAKSDTGIYCWGSNEKGALGAPIVSTSTPHLVSSFAYDPATALAFEVGEGGIMPTGTCQPISIVSTHNQCLSSYLQDEEDITLTIIGSSNGAFYSDDACASPITTTSIAEGENSVRIYIQDPDDGVPMITATGQNFTTGSTTVQFLTF
ncbi:hypothetical protein K2X33_13490, partial [bacterium]|nr:hypothetical protein [bacterium]